LKSTVENFLVRCQSLDYDDELIYMVTRDMQKGVLVANIIGFTLFTIVMIGYIPSWILAIWFVLQIALLVIRIYVVRRLDYYTRAQDYRSKKWLFFYLVSTTGSAILWGATSFLAMAYVSLEYIFFTMTILLTLTAGATSTLGAVFHAYMAFTLPIFLMLSASFIFFASDIHYLIAFVMILAMHIIIGNGYTYYLKLKRMVNLAAELKSFNYALEDRVKKEMGKNIEKDVQILHQARLAQMGEMISMIAHQWRQPLNIISTAACDTELKIQFGQNSDETTLKNIATINNSAQYLSTTIDDFRAFFQITKEKTITSLDDVVYSTLKIVKEYVENKKISIQTDLESHEKFDSYPNEIKQVLLNLLKNAEDALLDNHVNGAYIKISTRSDEENCYLNVEDNAGGIDPKIGQKVFNAYYSTKAAEKGSGLGLYMSRLIIEDHCRGSINYSLTDEGTRFCITIPKEF